MYVIIYVQHIIDVGDENWTLVSILAHVFYFMFCSNEAKCNSLLNISSRKKCFHNWFIFIPTYLISLLMWNAHGEGCLGDDSIIHGQVFLWSWYYKNKWIGMWLGSLIRTLHGVVVFDNCIYDYDNFHINTCLSIFFSCIVIFLLN
jgi:hypothetical protein